MYCTQMFIPLIATIKFQGHERPGCDQLRRTGCFGGHLAICTCPGIFHALKYLDLCSKIDCYTIHQEFGRCNTGGECEGMNINLCPPLPSSY